MKSGASTCSGSCTKAAACCKQTIVPVTDADVRRLMHATGLPADAIARLYSSAELDYDGDKSWIRFPYGKRVLALKQTGLTCKFLSQHGLCTVYDARPVTCRTYPYMVYLGKDGRPISVALNKDVECCGRLGRHWPRKQLLADAREEDTNDRRFFARLRRWEKRGAAGGKRGLFRFLRLHA